MIRHRISAVEEHEIPVIWEVTHGRDSGLSSICRWLTQQKPLIDSILDQKGALLIRGFSRLKTAADFESAITSIYPNLRDYIGGTSPREVVHGKIMTATYTPPSWSIPLHQEMAYTRNSPDRIAFFCVQPGLSGGSSTLGDMRKVTRAIPAELMRKAQAHGWQLRRTLTSEEKSPKKAGIQKPWSEVFGTKSRSEAEQIAGGKGWRIDWLEHDTMRLWQEVLPATRVHPANHAQVWFNQIHFFAPICMSRWAQRDGRAEDHARLIQERRRSPEMIDEVFFGNGERVSDQDALKIAAILERAEVEIRLATSDLLILDNILVAHGRTAFSGKRDVLVALINMPEFHVE
jgi:hypothetical protein